jgi:hypothetical protein
MTMGLRNLYPSNSGKYPVKPSSHHETHHPHLIHIIPQIPHTHPILLR